MLCSLKCLSLTMDHYFSLLFSSPGKSCTRHSLHVTWTLSSISGKGLDGQMFLHKWKKIYAGAEALMLQVTRAHICEALMTWAGMENLESRPLNLEILPQSATVQEKHEFLEGCNGNFVDKYALVVPDVKGEWEMEEAQHVESEQFSNHMPSQTNQNLYRPGKKLLKLYCCLWQWREIFFIEHD